MYSDGIDTKDQGASSQEEQQLLVFGQLQDNELTNEDEQTFRSGFGTFVSPDPVAYGVIEERNSIFKPGEEALLYVEPVGLTYKNTTDKMAISYIL